MLARLAFWYGLSLADVAALTGPALRAYLAELPAVQAEWQLMLMRAEQFPWLREADQRRTLAELQRQAAGGGRLPAPKPTVAHLRLLHIGVRYAHEPG